MKKLVLFVLCFNASSAIGADRIIGKVKTILPYLPESRVYIKLDGDPIFDGHGCDNFWVIASMSDDNFKGFTYPLIVAAKAANADIEVRVSGCTGVYPNIVGIEYSPR